MDHADYVRDAKQDKAMCAHGLCTVSHNLKEGPDGYSGPYGGSKLCEQHYKKIVDHIRTHGCLPSEKE
jgi:hypothetical protein